MPNLNKEQWKQTATATTKRNDDSQEGGPDTRIKVILVKLDAVEENNNTPCAFKQFLCSHT